MSVLLPTRPLNAVAAAAIALLVVGAGGAVGIGTSGSSGSTRTGSSSLQNSSPGNNGNGGSANGNTAPGQPNKNSTTTAPSETPTSIGAVPVGGQAGSPTTVAGRTTTTTTGAAGSTTTTPTLPANPSDEPAPGTYTYATQGSASSPTQTYTFPPQTTIVIAKSGCGETDQWNEGKGNSTTLAGCPATNGIRILSESVTTSGVTLTFTCDPDSFVPLSGRPGATWKWSCHTSDGKETTAQTVVLDGPATMSVAGTPMQTEHVSVHSVLSGEVAGTSDVEDWLDHVGLRIKESGSSNAGAGAFTFKSQYTIQLQSLAPS